MMANMNPKKSAFRPELLRALLYAAPLIALLAWLFEPSFAWMVDRWMARDSYFAHGFMIPLVSLFWVWQKREVLLREELRPSRWGIPFLAAASLIQVTACVLRVYFMSSFAFVMLITGLVLSLGGTRVFKHVWFPVFFLLLMIPLPLLAISEITLKMKFFVTQLAVDCLNVVGMPAQRNGSYLLTPNAFLLVGDPCSGLRSFLAFLCLGFVFAYGGRTAWWGKLVLVISGLPLAIFSNLLRVFSLAIIAEIYGQEAAHGAVHDASGIVVFVIAFTMFLGLRHALERNAA